MAAQDQIQGLREQIKANAAVLFPKALEEFGALDKEVAFEVVLIRAVFDPAKGYQHQAILMSGPPTDRRDATNATASDTIEEALQALLYLTEDALYKKRLDSESDVTTDAQGQSEQLETFEVGWVSKTLS